MIVAGIGLGVLAAGEHHPGHLALEQHVDVLGLGHAAGAGAQHAVEPALRQRTTDHLGKSREDRVRQLRHDEADHPGPAATQLGRSLIADDVERGEHRIARRGRDPGLAVEDTADRRLADAGLLGDGGKMSRHVLILLQTLAIRCKLL